MAIRDLKDLSANLGVGSRPEIAILGPDQKERGLWGREWKVTGELTGVDRKCLNRAHAQSLDHCEGVGSITSRCPGKEPGPSPELTASRRG